MRLRKERVLGDGTDGEHGAEGVGDDGAVVEVHQTSHDIGKDGPRPGFIVTTTESFPGDSKGWERFIAEWPKFDRAEMLEGIRLCEDYAQRIARAEEFESAMEWVDESWTDDSGTRHPCGYLAGANAPKGSALHFAFHLERHVRHVREVIERFEKNVPDEAARKLFYEAMCVSMMMVDDVYLMRTATLERAVLRGREESFNHDGASDDEKRQAVRRVRELVKGDPTNGVPPMKKGAAVQAVATEFGKARSTLYGWIRKFPL